MNDKDMVGNQLHIGDYVVHSGGEYKNLSFGRILKITPKSIKVATNHQINLGRTTLLVSQVAKVMENQVPTDEKQKLDALYEKELTAF